MRNTGQGQNTDTPLRLYQRKALSSPSSAGNIPKESQWNQRKTLNYSSLQVGHKSQVAQWQRIHLQCRRHKRFGFNPWVRKIPWKKTSQPTPVFLPGKPHGQRSLVGYSLLGCKESNMTKHSTARCWEIYEKVSLKLRDDR